MNDTTSNIIAIVALLFSFGTFAWQYLRVTDAAMCTLVASDINSLSHRAVFEFAIANLGTRALLLRSIDIEIFGRADRSGTFTAESKSLGKSLPEVIKPGDMTSVQIEARWTLTYLSQVAIEAEKRKVGNALYFNAVAVFWDPTGKRHRVENMIATLEFGSQGSSSFRISRKRDFGFPVVETFAVI